ncbi:MAG: alpha/beta hydrolase [Pseudomonadota bacterium]|nr:alpha/beta hydrolase [Pseudomonadota bacterium]
MTDFVEVGEARLEYTDIPASRIGLPALLLLHEGLGSVSMWRDFPAQLARSTGCRIVAYSRAGFGRSSPRSSPYTPRFIHEEAFEVIPALRAQLGIDPVVLVGHSTGASMALVHASANAVAGVVAMAPLTTVEGSNVESIERAGKLYRTTDWRSRLARHHVDVDAVFHGWNDTWLRPDFRNWNILDDLRRVSAPVLAILGSEDEYSTPAQVAAIAENVPDPSRFQSLLLPGCGHAPHREQPDAVLRAVKGFLGAL